MGRDVNDLDADPAAARFADRRAQAQSGPGRAPAFGLAFGKGDNFAHSAPLPLRIGPIPPSASMRSASEPRGKSFLNAQASTASSWGMTLSSHMPPKVSLATGV